MNNNNLSVHKAYKKTIWACYIAHMYHAIIINITPVLFIPLREQFGFTFAQLGLLVLINFSIPIVCDILFGFLIDRFGFKIFAATSHILGCVGLFVFAFSPYVTKSPYTGFVCGTVIISLASGILKVLLSPIINSLPLEDKSSEMSILHSFYAWGQIGVVLITTLFLFIFGKDLWQIIVFVWILVPLCNLFLFISAPMPKPVDENVRLDMKNLLLKPTFIIAFFAILFGAAAEVNLSSWISAYLEKAMLIPKEVGDILGMCMFGLTLGMGRLLHGKFGEKEHKGKKIDISDYLIFSAALAVVCYLVIALSPFKALSVAACAISGFSVCLMWPGALSLAAKCYPLAGSWIFAVLACGGDIGCAVGPYFTSYISDYAVKLPFAANLIADLDITGEQFGLKAGMFAATVFPILTLVCHIILKKIKPKEISYPAT